jgi:hypothetical protein
VVRDRFQVHVKRDRSASVCHAKSERFGSRGCLVRGPHELYGLSDVKGVARRGQNPGYAGRYHNLLSVGGYRKEEEGGGVKKNEHAWMNARNLKVSNLEELGTRPE